MPPNLITDRAADRLGDLVRQHEREVQDLTRDPRQLITVPFELSLFECSNKLLLPQNGPGVCLANKLRWDPTESHVGLEYGLFLGIPAESWLGDVSDQIRPDDPNGATEEIILVDHSRRHSKMATPDGRVGAYGVAWKMHGSQVRVRYNNVDPSKTHYEVWSILTMQTPGRIQGYVDGELTTATESIEINVFRISGAGHVSWDGYDPWLDAEAVTVYNIPGGGVPYIFETDDGNVLIADWHARLGRYQTIQAECPLVSDDDSYLMTQFYNE